MVATIMNICPIMRLDDKGAIKAYSKVRGKKKAVEATVNAMEEHAQGGRDYDQRCFVCHSQCPEDAQMLALLQNPQKLLAHSAADAHNSNFHLDKVIK